MKFIYLIFAFCFLQLVSCSTQNQAINSDEINNLSFEPDENGEYDIIVLDPQYDIYLKTIARPESYYTESYYKSKNRIYSTIWNQRHLNPLSYNPNIYAVSINLNPNINYGLNFEYKLYHFFKFMEWKNKIHFT